MASYLPPNGQRHRSAQTHPCKPSLKKHHENFLTYTSAHQRKRSINPILKVFREMKQFVHLPQIGRCTCFSVLRQVRLSEQPTQQPGVPLPHEPQSQYYLDQKQPCGFAGLHHQFRLVLNDQQ